MNVENVGVIAAVEVPDIRIAFEKLDLRRVADGHIEVLIVDHERGL